MVRTEMLRKLIRAGESGPWSSCADGSQDHDLVLRLSKLQARFAHIPYVLYHWRYHWTSFSQTQAEMPSDVFSGLADAEGGDSEPAPPSAPASGSR